MRSVTLFSMMRILLRALFMVEDCDGGDDDDDDNYIVEGNDDDGDDIVEKDDADVMCDS